MKINKMLIIYILCAALLMIIMVLFGLSWNMKRINAINNFEDCKNAGYPIMESYPEQCTVSNGKTFFREIEKNNEYVNCTMDAKECPNGSFVGRIAPSCEFAPCP